MRRYMNRRDELRESARQKLADAEKRGLVFAAIVRGDGCCQINDPEWTREWWNAVLAEYERLAESERVRRQLAKALRTVAEGVAVPAWLWQDAGAASALAASDALDGKP